MALGGADDWGDLRIFLLLIQNSVTAMRPRINIVLDPPFNSVAPLKRLNSESSSTMVTSSAPIGMSGFFLLADPGQHFQIRSEATMTADTRTLRNDDLLHHDHWDRYCWVRAVYCELLASSRSLDCALVLGR